MEIAATIEEFLLAGRGSGWSERTVAGYRWRLNRLNTWLVEHQALAVEDLTRRRLREWAGGLTGAPATRRGAIVAARAWLNWLHAEGDLPEAADLLRALVAPKVPATIQRTLTVAEVAQLLEAAEIPATRGVSVLAAGQICARNRAICGLLFDSLLRASELCALQVCDLDLDLDGGTVTVKHGKGGRGRLAPFGATTAELLRVWLVLHPPAHLQQPLFVALGGQEPGQALTPRGLGVILQRLGERAGVANVSPHAFRRGGACEAIWNGVSSRVVMSVGGWTNLEMVERYTRDMELRQGRTQEQYRLASPTDAASKSGR